MIHQFVDDQGEAYTPVSHVALLADPRMDDPRFRLIVRRVVMQNRYGIRAVDRKFVALCFAGATVFFCLGSLAHALWSLTAWWIFLGSCSVICIGLCVWHIILQRIRTAPVQGNVVRVMLADSLCPSCVYPLAGLDLQAAGTVQCPECSAHWRGERCIRKTDFPERTSIPPSRALREKYPYELDGFFLFDDRQQRVPEAKGLFHLAVEAEGDNDRRGRLEAVLRSQTSERPGCLRVGTYFVLFATILALGRYVYTVVQTGQFIAGNQFGLLSIAILLAGNFRYLAHLQYVRSTREKVLAQRICPACADFLDWIEPDSDGCTVCQTCGAAWRL